MDTQDKKVIFSMYSEEEFENLVSLIQNIVKNSNHIFTPTPSPITAFGYFFSNVARNISIGENIIFDKSENVLNLSFTPVTSVVVINLTGIYKVSYGINTTQATSSIIELTQNGITVPGSSIQSMTSIGQLSGDVLVAAPAGTVLQMRILRSEIELAPEVNAYMNILRIG